MGKGHTGAKVTLDDLHDEWILELRRKSRSPNTICRRYQKVYRRNISPTLGSLPVIKVTTKTLTDLYRATRSWLFAPQRVTDQRLLSSMLTQASRWGWRDLNSRGRDHRSLPRLDH